MNREIKATRHLDCFTVLVDQRFVLAEVENQALWSWNRWRLRLALVVWNWHGLVARLSICPLEKSPVLLESIIAPVEEIAITISDGRAGERQEPHPFLEYDQTYGWNIFTKHHYTNVPLIPSL